MKRNQDFISLRKHEVPTPIDIRKRGTKDAKYSWRRADILFFPWVGLFDSEDAAVADATTTIYTSVTP